MAQNPNQRERQIVWEAEFARIWEECRNEIIENFNRAPQIQSYQKYTKFSRLIEHLCVNFRHFIDPGGQSTHYIPTDVSDLLCFHIVQLLREITLDIANDKRDPCIGMGFARLYVSKWTNFECASEVLSKWWQHFNRHSPQGSVSVRRNVYDLAMEAWKVQVLTAWQDDLSLIVSRYMEKLRSDDNLDLSSEFANLMGVVFDSLTKIGLPDDSLYRGIFENPLIEESEQCFRKQFKRLGQLPMNEYMARVTEIIEQEENRETLPCILPTTTVKLVHTCADEMIFPRSETLTAELIALLANQRTKDAKLLYNFIKISPQSAARLHLKIQEFVFRQSYDELRPAECDLIESFTTIVHKYSQLSHSVFGGNLMLAKFIHNGLSLSFTSTTPTATSATILATLFDFVLKRSTIHDQDKTLILDILVRIFESLEDKNSFSVKYAELLVNRLKNKEIISDDMELATIRNLKENGTTRPSQLLTDLWNDAQHSKTLTLNFNSDFLVQNLHTPHLDCNFTVFGYGRWPFKRNCRFVGLKLPPEDIAASFKKFYLKEYNTRALRLQFEHSTGQLATNCFGKEYILELTTPEIAVMLQFNDVHVITLNDLAKKLGIMKVDVRKVVANLQDGQLLISTHAGISVNSGFHHENELIELQRLEPSESPPQHTLKGQQRFQVKCAIVRTMRTNKVLARSDLLSNVIEKLADRFTPKMSLIDECITSLAQGGYINCDNDNSEINFIVN